jgi:L-cystine uptake protein TcyP (sodium:dicarboxylate symporter family)
MIALALTVIFPLMLFQLYTIYIGPLSLDCQLGVGLFLSVILGLALHVAYRSSAKNQP